MKIVQQYTYTHNRKRIKLCAVSLPKLSYLFILKRAENKKEVKNVKCDKNLKNVFYIRASIVSRAIGLFTHVYSESMASHCIYSRVHNCDKNVGRFSFFQTLSCTQR